MIPNPNHLPRSLAHNGPKPPPLPRRDRTYIRVKKALADLTQGRRQRVLAFADTLRGMPKVHTVRTMGMMGTPLPTTLDPKVATAKAPRKRGSRPVIVGLSVLLLAGLAAVGAEVPELIPGDGVAAVAPVSERPAHRTYTVRKGDTLGTIARRTLGSSKRWRDILRINAATLPNPNVLEVGAVLRLPPAS